MPEVPTYQNIHASDGRQSHMDGVRPTAWTDYTMAQIGIRQRIGLRRICQDELIRLGNLQHPAAHTVWRALEFPQRMRRQHLDKRTLDEKPPEREARFREFAVLAPADDRGIKLDVQPLHQVASLRLHPQLPGLYVLALLRRNEVCNPTGCSFRPSTPRAILNRSLYTSDARFQIHEVRPGQGAIALWMAASLPQLSSQYRASAASRIAPFWKLRGPTLLGRFSSRLRPMVRRTETLVKSEY